VPNHLDVNEALVDPIFVSVKQAAHMLAVSPWTCYQLLEAQTIASQYQGRRRLVLLSSLREYAANLPTARPEAEVTA
jgi:hypothetical protein